MKIQSDSLKNIKILIFSLLLLLSRVYSQDRPKIGLVLSGGGAKGLAHIPVLKLLDELDIPIDYIAGTSAGGIAGALYARGLSGIELEKMAAEIDWQDMFSDRPQRSLLPFFEKKINGRFQLDFVLRKGIPAFPQALIYGQKFSTLFSQLTFPLPGNADFDQLPIPFRCVAVDLVKGQEVVLAKGSLPKAMRATMAIPTVFTPVDWADHLLVDGGVLNNLPVDIIKEMGAEIVIAVDLGNPLSTSEELGTADKVLAQTFRIMETDQKREQREKVDILIQPNMKGLRSVDLFFPERLSKIREQGEIAAQESRPLLEALKQKYGLSRSKEAETRSKPAPLQMFTSYKEVITLGRIEVSGNKKLPSAFISRLFSLKPGDAVDGKRISRQIMELYALGYFESIEYDILPAENKSAGLLLRVKELPPGRLRIGLRYDNLHKLVAAAGIYFTNLLVPGLRLENELEVAGLTRFHSKISYPSQTLNFPLYPFFYGNYKSVPTRLYNEEGSLMASFKDRSLSFGAGVGFLIKKRLNVEIAWEQEEMHVDPVGDVTQPGLLTGLNGRLRKISVEATIDTLDDIWTPSRGLFFRGSYEGSYGLFGSGCAYEILECSLDIYRTFGRNHTLRFHGYRGDSSGRVPFFKFLDQGRPEAFIGMKYDQLAGTQMTVLRGEYRSKFNSFVYLKAAGNVALDFEQRWPEANYAPGFLWGVGAGVQLSTPAGPLDLGYGLGSKSLREPKSAQHVFYLRLGAKF
jgi:NTE family protein